MRSTEQLEARRRPIHLNRSPSVEDLIREGHATLSALGADLSPGKVAGLARRYRREVDHNRWSFRDFLINQVHLVEPSAGGAACDSSARVHPDSIRAKGTTSDPTPRRALRGGPPR